MKNRRFNLVPRSHSVLHEITEDSRGEAYVAGADSFTERERVLEIADLDTGDCYEGYTYSASIKYFTRHVTQHYFVSVMETIYY